MKKVGIIASLIAMGSVPVVAQSTVNFNAKGLIVISDGDLAASGLVDGKLLTDNTAKDQLTAIKFPLERGSKGLGTALVSNSVIGVAKTIAVQDNGTLAFVLENKLRPADGVTQYADAESEFPAGEKLYVVDIANLSAPKAKFGFPVGKKPLAIDINKNELMITTSEAGKELVFIEAAPDGKPGRFLNLPAAIDSASNISDISWHPSGDYLAFTLDNANEVGLYKVLREAGKLKNIEMVGKPVKVGVDPSFGRFSSDGKHYFVLDSKGKQARGTEAGEIHVVDFSMDGSTEHKVVSKGATGVNANSFAVSPDGTMLAAVSAAASASPWSVAGAGKGAMLTLYTIATDGGLAKIADYPVEGIYPRSVAFDKDGSNLAVSVFEYLEYGQGNGGVEFWSVVKGGAPSLKKQEAKISVGKGAHTLRVIK